MGKLFPSYPKAAGLEVVRSNSRSVISSGNGEHRYLSMICNIQQLRST